MRGKEMRIKIYRGKSITSLLHHIREECGKRAQILSTRRRESRGYEIEVLPDGDPLLGVDDLFSMSEEKVDEEPQRLSGEEVYLH